MASLDRVGFEGSSMFGVGKEGRMGINLKRDSSRAHGVFVWELEAEERVGQFALLDCSPQKA
jgi:hypothetical protein